MNIHCQCSRYIYPQAKQVIWEVLVIAINAPYCLCFIFVLAIMVTLIYACPSEIQCYFGYIVMTEKLYSMGLHLGIIRIKNPMKGSHVNPWLIHVNVWQKPLQYCKVISLQLIKINEKKKSVYFSCVFKNCGNKHSVNFCSPEDQYKMAWDHYL